MKRQNKTKQNHSPKNPQSLESLYHWNPMKIILLQFSSKQAEVIIISLVILFVTHILTCNSWKCSWKKGQSKRVVEMSLKELGIPPGHQNECENWLEETYYFLSYLCQWTRLKQLYSSSARHFLHCKMRRINYTNSHTFLIYKPMKATVPSVNKSKQYE